MDQLLHAMTLAPSAGNLQSYAVKVIACPELQRRLAAAAGQQMFLCEAAALLLFCADGSRSAARYRKRGESLYSVQDATIACTFAMLAATDVGLASVWVGAFDEDWVRRIVGAPDALRPVAILALGYGDERPDRRPRRPIEEVAQFSGYGEPV
jgi:nitroreductase